MKSGVKFALVLIAAGMVASPADSRAERVGYAFEGALVGSPTQTFNLFGVTVPRNSPVSGTFSYDTTAASAEIDDGALRFHQEISGGLRLDINDGAIQLSASQHAITVADDFPRDPEAVDLFSVDFDSRWDPSPEPVVVNGQPWEGTAILKVELSWLWDTFTDVDEPKLTSDRPLTPDAAYFAFVGSSPAVRLFSISSLSAIVPPVGDYNHDGTVDDHDYFEWRRAFGQSEGFLYADGNHNGQVDAADYVVWRDALGSVSAPAALRSSVVPEPTGPVAIVPALLMLAGRRWNEMRS